MRTMITGMLASHKLENGLYSATTEEMCSIVRKLNGTALKVYEYFKSFENADGILHADMEVVAKNLGLSRRTLWRTMANVEDLLDVDFNLVKLCEVSPRRKNPEEERTAINDATVERVSASESESSLSLEVELSQIESVENSATTEPELLQECGSIEAASPQVTSEEVAPSKEVDTSPSASAVREGTDELQVLKAKLLAAATLAQLQALKQNYGRDKAQAAWQQMTPEQKGQINAIVDRDAPKVDMGEGSAPAPAIPLRQGAPVLVWMDGGWRDGFWYMGPGDTQTQSNRTGALELAHAVQGRSGRVVWFAQSDLYPESRAGEEEF